MDGCFSLSTLAMSPGGLAQPVMQRRIGGVVHVPDEMEDGSSRWLSGLCPGLSVSQISIPLYRARNIVGFSKSGGGLFLSSNHVTRLSPSPWVYRKVKYTGVETYSGSVCGSMSNLLRLYKISEQKWHPCSTVCSRLFSDW